MQHSKHSTKGCGRYVPDPSEVLKQYVVAWGCDRAVVRACVCVVADLCVWDEFDDSPDGFVVPYGRDSEAKLAKPTSLLYNEFIVYDVKQVRARACVCSSARRAIRVVLGRKGEGERHA